MIKIPASNEIQAFLLTLKDAQKEKDFLEWSFPEQFSFFKKMVYLGIAATLFFVIPDWFKSGMSISFLYSFAFRFIFSLVVFIILKIIERLNKPLVYHRFLFLLSILITINTTSVILIMHNHSVVYALSEIIGIIVMYVILRQRFIYSLISAVPASIILIFSHILFGNLDQASLQTIIYAFTFANIIGIMFNRNINYSTRKEYLSLLNEQKLNSRLQKEIEQRVLAQKDLLNLARTDHLTGLFNRRFFIDLAEQEILKCERYGQTLSLLTLDIDFFKAINDQYGHQEGDIVLINLSEKLRSQVRKSDIISRIGGEEFIVLATNTILSDAAILAESLRKIIMSSELGSKKSIKVTLSIGIAEYHHGNTLTQLMQKSDRALYEAKEAGRNCVVTWQ